MAAIRDIVRPDMMKDFALARRNMVNSQLETNKVIDPEILRVFSEIPREGFLPETLRDFAYMDEDIQIAPDRYVMEPMILARLIQAAAIQPRERILDIGAAGGYGAAILSQLADRVVCLECDAELATRTRQNLANSGIENVQVVTGSLGEGYPASAPYDVIILEGAVDALPPSLKGQLGEGGRLLSVQRASMKACGRAALALRCGEEMARQDLLFDANTPFLPGFPAPNGWQF